MSQVTPMPARPQTSQFKPLNEVTKIDDMLRHPGMVERFKQAMPRHLSSERMLRVCMLAVNKTPKLAQCDLWSLTGAMLSLASLGLEPNTTLGHAYLIPFEKTKWNPQTRRRDVEKVECQVVIGYRGLIDLARRSGNLVSLHADVVYEGDEFSFEYGSGMHLKHIPMGKRDKPLWAYAHAKLTDGEAFEVLPYNLVLKIRDGSQGYQAAARALEESKKSEKDAWKRKSYDTSPWVAHEHEMASKTMIRRISKNLPMSIEFMTAVELDAKNDAMTFDYGAIAHMPDANVIDQVGQVIDTADVGEPDQAQAESAEAKPVATEAVAETKQTDPQVVSDAASDGEEAPMFTIVGHDGKVLEYEEYGDFAKAIYIEMEMAKKGGKDALTGWHESQNLDQIMANYRPPFDKAYAAALASFEPKTADEGKLA